MKPNEVILELKLILGGCTRRDTPYYKALTEAIRCVELVPEVEHCINSCIETGIVDWLDEAKRLIDKAKGANNADT